MVTIGGSRIHPGEIEAMVLGLADVTECVVVPIRPTRRDIGGGHHDGQGVGVGESTYGEGRVAAVAAGGSSRRGEGEIRGHHESSGIHGVDAECTALVAHVVATPGVDASVIRARVMSHVAAHLPPHTRPAAVHVHERLPRSSRGKVDVRALQVSA